VTNAGPKTPTFDELDVEDPTSSKKRKAKGIKISFPISKVCKGVAQLNGEKCFNVVHTDNVLCPPCKVIASDHALTSSVSRIHTKKSKDQNSKIQTFLATEPRPPDVERIDLSVKGSIHLVGQVLQKYGFAVLTNCCSSKDTLLLQLNAKNLKEATMEDGAVYTDISGKYHMIGVDGIVNPTNTTAATSIPSSTISAELKKETATVHEHIMCNSLFPLLQSINAQVTATQPYPVFTEAPVKKNYFSYIYKDADCGDSQLAHADSYCANSVKGLYNLAYTENSTLIFPYTCMSASKPVPDGDVSTANGAMFAFNRFSVLLSPDADYSLTEKLYSRMVPVSTSLHAGDFVVFMGDLVHRGPPNPGNNERVSLFCNTESPGTRENQVHVGQLTADLINQGAVQFGNNCTEKKQLELAAAYRSEMLAHHLISLNMAEDNIALEHYFQTSFGYGPPGSNQRKEKNTIFVHKIYEKTIKTTVANHKNVNKAISDTP
jgi:hypothetical protein